jgi:two-component system chemotaxis response regulator CheB
VTARHEKTRASPIRRIVVVGASAGGFQALGSLVGQLPKGFAAAVLLVLHIAPEFAIEGLVDMLNRRRTLRCKVARDGETLRAGCVYVAPPEGHMLVKANKVLLTKGAHENRHRPAIDPLFRSAAVAHGSHVIGVVLTGMQDDGTSGLDAIARCGGITVVQDPADAAFAAMPQSALDHVSVAHRVPLAQMGALLESLVQARPPRKKRPPRDVVTEAIIAERVVSDVHAANGLGEQVPHNCPTCGGVLWKMTEPNVLRYRCHTGHAFTAESLLAAQHDRIEETLWITLRMLEERLNLSAAIAKQTGTTSSRASEERARATELHIARIREILRSSAP